MPSDGGCPSCSEPATLLVTNARLPRALVPGGRDLVVDPGLGSDRARFHLLLRSHRGLAGRCSAGYRLRGVGRDVSSGKGQAAGGAATLVGLDSRRFLGPDQSRLPYLVRSFLLVAVILAAWLWMRDLGFQPIRGLAIGAQVAGILRNSVQHGFGNRPVRMFMFGCPIHRGSRGLGLLRVPALRARVRRRSQRHLSLRHRGGRLRSGPDRRRFLGSAR